MKLKFEQRKALVDAAIKQFKHWDEDGDGELDEDELDFMLEQCGISLTRPQVRQIVAYCDADRNGKISLKELKWLLTCPDSYAEDLDFNDPPDLKRWVQKQFQPRPAEPPQWKQLSTMLYKSLAPVRICHHSSRLAQNFKLTTLVFFRLSASYFCCLSR
jgi:hypothetical protein